MAGASRHEGERHPGIRMAWRTCIICQRPHRALLACSGIRSSHAHTLSGKPPTLKAMDPHPDIPPPHHVRMIR